MHVLDQIRDRLNHSLWLVPSLMVMGAIGLALLTTFLDDISEARPFTAVVFTGGTESARAILQTVANAVITFTALVFTITIVALQLASSQFSPRVLRTFLRDRHSKFALGMFVSTFIYCLMVLRVVSATDDRGVRIPSISMMVLLVLILASVAMFVSYISHMANSIRASHIIEAAGNETRSLIGSWPDRKELLGKHDVSERSRTSEVAAPVHGSLVSIDHRSLVELARKHDAAIVMLRSVGDFVAAGQTVAEIRGGSIDGDVVCKRLVFGPERTMQQDVAFGLRQLVDIAEKALSPSMNDPTTAVMAVDQIHDLLRRLAAREFPETEHVDDDGIVRLITRPLEWDALVSLSLTEIRQFSDASLQVTRRVFAAIDDLDDVALPERRPALQRERILLQELVERSFSSEHDRRLAATPDQQGIGSG